ncbi:Ts translation elongation factor, mitochondrial [Homo sapiens]|uniref:Ts translation elongation factor, mitochondrial n=1 Tax=Homo sapiens TaxID=9606 RepID=A0A494C1D5_HUMAN|nr:Ts translation elongation factor, mitochondrial [Homo sapiens]KAI4066948.1 Ts translation elongation factor, mitochondrial [Homo sapiens]
MSLLRSLRVFLVARTGSYPVRSPGAGWVSSASVAPAKAHILCWAPSVCLGLQQGAPHEAAAENRLLLCKLQESSGDLWRGPQTGRDLAPQGGPEGGLEQSCQAPREEDQRRPDWAVAGRKHNCISRGKL